MTALKPNSYLNGLNLLSLCERQKEAESSLSCLSLPLSHCHALMKRRKVSQHSICMPLSLSKEAGVHLKPFPHGFAPPLMLTIALFSFRSSFLARVIIVLLYFWYIFNPRESFRNNNCFSNEKLNRS